MILITTKPKPILQAIFAMIIFWKFYIICCQFSGHFAKILVQIIRKIEFINN